MLKQNTDAVVKIILIIIFIILMVVILRAADINAEQPIEMVVVEAEPVIQEEVIAYCPDIEKPKDKYLDKIKKWEKEYYYATKTWEYLRQRNFSQAATCGIIGNMMIETSGGTLDLKPNIYSPSGNYYGLCQWSQKYYPETKNISFEHQLEYLLESIPKEFSMFGWLYEEGFTYEDFITMKDPAEAALVFAKVYERCRPVSYSLREQAAELAYDYFDLK